MGEVPAFLRSAIAEQLHALVAGDFPELLVWVNEYGADGDRLVAQPPEIWTHPESEAIQTADGGWHVAVPLWTEAEAPSDLSAEIIFEPDGVARMHDVHVL